MKFAVWPFCHNNYNSLIEFISLAEIGVTICIIGTALALNQVTPNICGLVFFNFASSIAISLEVSYYLHDWREFWKGQQTLFVSSPLRLDFLPSVLWLLLFNSTATFIVVFFVNFRQSFGFPSLSKR
ncbi:hypothetical protein WR25_24949 [Diploscapter pachys]|uniref:Uncharacterized protein n=1 Tax=Diploscapter pachys TaxID=2018661 RepID=A0A2A2J2W4_9BILA|nr:hypothetical protein WR25_24949 [Diploscapter pachys]